MALDTGCPILGSKCTAQNIKGGMFSLSWVENSGKERQCPPQVRGPGYQMKAGKAQCYPEAWASPGLCDKVWRLQSGLKLLSVH